MYIKTYIFSLLARNINWASVYRENKVAERSLQFTLKERFLGLEACFIVVNTQIGGQQLLMKARLASILNCHACRDVYTKRRSSGYLILRIRRNVLFLLEKQTESPLFTRPRKRFRLRALHIPVLCRLLCASSNARSEIVTFLLGTRYILTYKSIRQIYTTHL